MIFRKLFEFIIQEDKKMEATMLVANTILKRAFEENVDVSPMKLQKLMYFVYKKYIQDTGAALFDEFFEVWQNGPVLPTVYHEFKQYKKTPIKRYKTDSSY